MWGSSFVGCHPARIRPSFLPSLRPPRSLLHSLTHSLARSLAHSHTHSLPRSLTHSLTHSTPLTHSLTHRRSTQSRQKGLRRGWSPLAVFVAGAVPRASRRGCGARCRRWCRWLSSLWQAQYPEPPEGAAARVVAAGAAGCLRGRRSTQSLQKGLRRGLSPLGPLAVFVAGPGAVPRASRRGCGAGCPRWCRWLSSSWQAQYPEPPEGAAARVVAAGAAGCLPRGRRSIPRASRRGCGARCRRWCRWLSSWQAQYPEPPEGAAARVVAAGAAGCLRGRRSTQSLQKGLRRGLSPLVPLAVFLVAGAVPRASRRGCGARCRRWCRWLSSSWQAQYPEPPEGAAARVVAAGAAGCLRGRRSTQSLQKGLRRGLSPLVPLAVFVAGAVPRASRRGCGAGCRRWCRWLSSSWQAQYPEPPEGAAARVVAAGAAGCLPRGRRSTQSRQKGLRRGLSPLVLLAVSVAGAVPRASRRGCGARCRRWCRWLSSSWQAQPRASRRGCGAGCRRWCRWLSSWQAQYPEPPEGAAARVVAAGAAGCLPRGRRSTQSLQKGLRRALPLGAAGCLRGRRSTQSLQKGPRRALSPLVPLAVFLVKDVCEVCLRTGAIVICRTSVCAACESPCKCCIEVVCEACLCAAAFVICKERGSHCMRIAL